MKWIVLMDENKGSDVSAMCAFDGESRNVCDGKGGRCVGVVMGISTRCYRDSPRSDSFGELGMTVAWMLATEPSSLSRRAHQ